MAIKFTDLPQLSAPSSQDIIAIVDVSEDISKKISVSDLVPQLPINMIQEGSLEVTAGTVRWYAPYNLVINSIVANLGISADDTVAATIKKNGEAQTTVTFAATTTSGTSASQTISMSSGDYLTVDVDSTGTSVKGEDLYLQFLYSKS